MTQLPRPDLELKPDQLRRYLDPASLPFETTAEVPSLEGTIGQPRAIDAIEFGLEMRSRGYNIFVAGAPGSGRERTVRDYLERFARSRPTPPDWIYVHNFEEPDRPNAIQLPAGYGGRFAQEMEELVRAASQQIPHAFQSEEYERRREQAVGQLNQLRNARLSQLQAFAQSRGFLLEMTPAGIASMPVIEGKPVSNEEFEKLPAETKSEISRHNTEIQTEIAAALRELRALELQAVERVRELDRQIALFVIGPLITELREAYGLYPEIQSYLSRVQDDIPEHLAAFGPPIPEAASTPLAPIQEQQRTEVLSRYQVNVFIDNSATHGAPVVDARNPTYYNLVGRIDYRAILGAMVTDFRQIKPGALHHANGGFLLLDAIELLSNPLAWDALKRTLVCEEIQIENFGDQLTPIPTARLRPEPICLDLKVVLIGPAALYYALYSADQDFQELFKVRADFAPDMEWSAEHVHNYAAFISRRVREDQLRHFDRAAVARVVEHGARLREDQRRLSTRLLDIANVVNEASHWAVKAGHDPVMVVDVETAIERHAARSDLIEERVRDMILDGTIMIETTGQRVGQVNGMAIIGLGDYAFGQPAKITARIALGRGAIVSVERETQLSGPIHNKGVLILTSYLASSYAQQRPLAVSATLTFEQSYDEVEGDSASSAELYVLLSAISGIPLRQSIAVTGSVNQFGEVQAVGGVTRKIEGFYAICKARGLTGHQGVLLPYANVPNLMLADEIVEAARAGRFHVWAVRTIDEGIEILTGRQAGVRDEQGVFPEGTVHRAVEDRLEAFAHRLHDFGAAPDGVAVAGQQVALSRVTEPPKSGT